MGPCKNPNCKSYGKVHPNCRCYSQMAKGGEVSYCASGKPHQKGCHYFAEGGDSVPESLRANDDSDESTSPNHGVNININAQPAPQQQPPPQAQPDQNNQNYSDVTGGKTGLQKSLEGLVAKYPGLVGPQGSPFLKSYLPPQAPEPQPAPAMPSTPAGEVATNGSPLNAISPPPGSPEEADPQQAQQASPQVEAKVRAPDDSGHPSLPMPGQNKQEYTKSVYDDINHHASMVSADYANGRIAPKTYQELFAKNADGTDRGTLSKIGMIFSLMLGGAGAGLTHSSNVALDMMDKMIDNDLQAQKASKEGQNNFLNTAANYFRTKSEIGLQGKQGHLYDAQVQLANTNNQLLSVNLAKTNMMLATMQSIYGLADNMPPGQQKMKAAQVADGIHTAVNQHILQDNAKTAAAVGQNSEDAYNRNTQLLNQMALMGEPGADAQVKRREEHQIPGIGTSRIPLTSDDRKRVLQINNFQNLIQEAKDFQKKSELGAITPSQRARAEQLKADLVSSYNDVKGLARFTSNEENLYDRIIPNLGSNIGALTGAQKGLLDRLESSVQQKKDLEYKQLGITPFSNSQPSSQQGDSSMIQMISPKGQVGNVPRANLDRAMKLGYKAQ